MQTGTAREGQLPAHAVWKLCIYWHACIIGSCVSATFTAEHSVAVCVLDIYRTLASEVHIAISAVYRCRSNRDPE